MSYQRPQTGALVWIEYQGSLRRAVYLVHKDYFLLGDGTHVPATKVAAWYDELPDGADSGQATT